LFQIFVYIETTKYESEGYRIWKDHLNFDHLSECFPWGNLLRQKGQLLIANWIAHKTFTVGYSTDILTSILAG